MPDLDLHDLLDALADDVVVVDLLPEVHQRMRTRRRRRGRSAVAVTVLAGVGVAAGLVMWAGDSGPAQPGVSTTSTPTPSPPGTATATTSIYPSWLPPGVRLAGHGRVSPPGAASPGFRPVRQAWYRIAGPANANTIPPDGVTRENATTTHPRTAVQISFNPNVLTLPDIPVTPTTYDQRTINIVGNSATLSIPKSGYGAFRIDWVDADGYHVVMCDRLKTDQGRSGVGTRDLVRIAESLYVTTTTAPPPNLAPASWPTNSTGQTYGSAEGVTNPATLPHLIRVIATNGHVGYVYKKPYLTATQPSPSNPQVAATQGRAPSRTLPVYATNGRTKIGVFVTGVRSRT